MEKQLDNMSAHKESRILKPILTNTTYPSLSQIETFPVDTYLDIVGWNENRLKIVSFLLEHYLKGIDHQSYAVLTVGSDGRLEKGPYSPIEFCILCHDRVVGEKIKTVILQYANSSLNSLVNDVSHRIPVDADRIEIKVLSIDKESYGYLSGYNGDWMKLWPDRILSGYFLAGSKKIHEDAIYEVKKEFKTSRAIRSRQRKQLLSFLKTTYSGKSMVRGDELLHFSTVGKLFYNKLNNLCSLGTKFGPLRAWQQALTRRELTEEEIYPSNTILKSEAFGYDNQITSSYMYALLFYHLLQEQIGPGEQEVFITVDAAILNYITETIAREVEYILNPNEV